MESSYALRFSPDDTFHALVWAISELDGYRINQANEKELTAAIRVEQTLLLPDEKIVAEILPVEDGTSKIRVTATGDNSVRLQHRVNTVLCALSEQLANGHKLR